MGARNRHVFLLLCCVAIVLATILPAHAVELVTNGGFETGSFGSAWVHGAYRGNNNNPNIADHLVALDLPFTGNYSALLGFKYTTQTTNAYAYMYQQVAIPANVSSATLNFKMRMQGYDSSPYDPFIATLRSTSNNVLATVLNFSFTEYNDKFKDSGWLSDDNVLPVGYNVAAYAGQTIRLYFEQSNLFDALYETWTYVDNVSLVYKMWVDLAVDGNGDDVFGATGSGLGGISARSSVAGDTLYYTLTVENEGTVSDTYQLSATVPVGWTARIDGGSGYQAFPLTTPSMIAGSVGTYTVRVVSPVAAAVGTYNVIVNAVSTAQGSRVDSATLRANVVGGIHSVDAVVDGNGVGVVGDNGAGGFALKEAPWDSTVTWTVEVFNTGNAATAFGMSFTPAAGVTTDIFYNSVSYVGPFTTAAVPPGGSVSMTLRTTGPTPLPGGDYTTIVRAIAAADTLRKDSIRAVLRLRAPKVDMIIATSGDNIYGTSGTGLGGSSSNAGERGAVVSFPLIVQNESALADSFRLTWVAPAAGWTAVVTIGGVDRALPVTTPTFAAFSQANYVLKITIPAGAAFGTYESILNAASQRNGAITESVSAVVSVATPSEVDVTIDGNGAEVYGPLGTGLGGSSLKTVAPGDTALFNVTIENISGANNFQVSWNTPAGWQVTFNGVASPIASIVAGTYQVVAIVPSTSLGGTFDLIIDTNKVGKPFFMDSVTGRVVVVQPPIVDALIDGNGDGVIGATGTGAGGSSLQTTSAPATLNFTVELKNKGSSSDSYLVSWNAIAGWTATFGGGASPFVTAAIPPGGSHIYAFSAQVPPGAAVAAYAYVIDVLSQSDPGSAESVTASVTVVGPPRADLVIDGNGLGVFGLLGSGQGGTSTRPAPPGASYTAVLRVRNVGSFADSFRVDWKPPVGWPAGSVALSRGASVWFVPFWTPVIQPGQFLDYDVLVQVPAGIVGSHATILDAWSSLPPNFPESVALVTATMAVVRGRAFDDRDRSGTWTAGDNALAGVTVTELSTGAVAVTGGDGRYTISVASGTSARAAERNLSGWVSTSPDTLGPFALVAGDTVDADFGDIAPLYLSPGGVQQALAGSFTDFAHTIEVGTPGAVVLSANSAAGGVTMFMLDANANGVFDGTDRVLVAADLNLDPAVNNGVLHILLRAFVPTGVPAGTTIFVAIDASQNAGSTVFVADATDAMVVTGSALGWLALTKGLDRTSAAPGELITYSVTFVNTGNDTLQNLVLLDPISPWVDVVADAFGAGRDLEWQVGGQPALYLTFNSGDGDECDYSPTERLIRLILSRNSPFYVASGERGTFRYSVRVR